MKDFWRLEQIFELHKTAENRFKAASLYWTYNLGFPAFLDYERLVRRPYFQEYATALLERFPALLFYVGPADNGIAAVLRASFLHTSKHTSFRSRQAKEDYRVFADGARQKMEAEIRAHIKHPHLREDPLHREYLEGLYDLEPIGRPVGPWHEN